MKRSVEEGEWLEEVPLLSAIWPRKSIFATAKLIRPNAFSWYSEAFTSVHRFDDVIDYKLRGHRGKQKSSNLGGGLRCVLS